MLLGFQRLFFDGFWLMCLFVGEKSLFCCKNSQLTKSVGYAIIYKLSTRQRHNSDTKSIPKKFLKKMKKGIDKVKTL